MVQADSFQQAMREVIDQQMREAQREQTSELKKISNATGAMAEATTRGGASGYNVNPNYSMYSQSAINSSQAGGYYNYINQNVTTPFETQSTFRRATRSLDMAFGMGNDRVPYEDKLLNATRVGTNVSGTIMSGTGIGAGVGAMFATGNPIVGAVVGVGAAIGADEAIKNQKYQDYLFENSYKYINYSESSNPLTGSGFNRTQRQQLGKFIKNVNTDFFLSDDETKKMLEGFTDASLLRSVSDVQTFEKKFKSLISATKQSALTLKATYDETVNLMGQMEKMGINAENMPRLAAMGKVVGVMTGKDAGTSFQGIVSQAQQMASGTGLSTETLIKNLSVQNIVAQGMFDKFMKGVAPGSKEESVKNYIANVGGVEAYAQESYNLTTGALSQNQGALARAYFSYNDKTGFYLDQSKVAKYKGMNIQDIQNASSANDFNELKSKYGQERALQITQEFNNVNKTGELMAGLTATERDALMRQMVASYGKGSTVENLALFAPGMSQQQRVNMATEWGYLDTQGGMKKQYDEAAFAANVEASISKMNANTVSVWQRITTELEKVLQDNAFVDGVTTFADGIKTFSEDVSNFLNGVDPTLGKAMKGISIDTNYNLSSSKDVAAALNPSIDSKVMRDVSTSTRSKLQALEKGIGNMTGLEALQKKDDFGWANPFKNTTSLSESFQQWEDFISRSPYANNSMGKAEMAAIKIQKEANANKLSLMQEYIAGASIIGSQRSGDNWRNDVAGLEIAIGKTGAPIKASDITGKSANDVMSMVKTNEDISLMANNLTKGIMEPYLKMNKEQIDEVIKNAGVGESAKYKNWEDFDNKAGVSEADIKNIMSSLFEDVTKESSKNVGPYSKIGNKDASEVKQAITTETDLLTAFIDETVKRTDALSRGINLQQSTGYGQYMM